MITVIDSYVGIFRHAESLVNKPREWWSLYLDQLGEILVYQEKDSQEEGSSFVVFDPVFLPHYFHTSRGKVDISEQHITITTKKSVYRFDRVSDAEAEEMFANALKINTVS